ncbi:MAG TPA: discoidin domain-containing protein [Sedimentisphaerales bacterium]|mgnify:CR=1 FL=1|nr:discoidin domain-containing protein [Sedimentisphaerales bacterium]
MCKRLHLLLALACVLSLATVAPAAVDPDLVGWWWFDEGTGTTAADSSRYGNDGTLMGGASWAPGYFRTALQLDGVDDYVEVPDNTTLRAYGDVTVMAWINTPVWETPGQGYQGIIAKGNSVRSYSLYTTSSGVMHFSTGQPYVGTTSSATVPRNEWVHVCAMIINGGHAYFLNGEPAGTGGSGAAGPGDRDADPVLIGRTAEGVIRSFTGLIDDARIYMRGLTQEEIQTIMTGSDLFTTKAGNPVPGDAQTDVRRDVALSWTAGMYAASHDVYFGTVAEDVNNASRTNPMGVLVSQSQTATSYDPAGLLAIGQTYYWRVDEVNAPPSNTIFKGNLWSFTTEPLAYPITGVIATTNGPVDPAARPENTVNGSGLNANDQHSIASGDMWLTTAPAGETLWIQYEFDKVYKLHQMLVWNYNSQFELLLGFGIKGVTVEYSENGTNWTALGDMELAQATAKSTYVANTTIDFQGVAAKYVRLTVTSGWGPMGQYGLSEVRFLFIPAQAREPKPDNGATGIEPTATLSWRPGREAASHEVYIGTDPAALTLVDAVVAPNLTPGDLEFGQTYYWQVVEVNQAEAISTWAGDIWSFSTQEYALVDGFETYNDDLDAGTTIFDTWLDGWINNTGSTVGYFNAPFAEKTIIHSGKQSMPLAYDNTKSPFYSEAEREFQTVQNWTGNGADTLVLYVRGNAPDFVETAGGQIIMSAVGTDIWNNTDQFRYAYKSLSGNGSITVRVDSLVRSNEWAKAGVMIRETLEPGSKHAFVALTPEPSHGLSFQRRPVAGQASANTDVANIPLPHWVKLTRTGNVFTAQQSADGVTWTDIVVSPALTIEMAANVYIGLAVCSHDGAIVTAAEFSNLSTTGNVTGAWQTAEIGVAQPQGNSAESIYVALEDTTGKTKVVANPNASATASPGWTEWRIPFNDFTGVNLGRIQTMYIGVGNRTSPTAGGTGRIFIDDIGYGHPADQ